MAPAGQMVVPTIQGLDARKAREQAAETQARESLSKVFVPANNPYGLPPGFVDKEYLTQLASAAREDRRDERSAAAIAAADARQMRTIAALGDRQDKQIAAQEHRLRLQGKVMDILQNNGRDTATSFISQPLFSRVPAPERTKAVMLNGLITMAQSYRDLVDGAVGSTGLKLAGEDAATIEAMHAKLMFEGASGFGQGALQAPDLAQMRSTFFNPTEWKQAPSTLLLKGRKEGRLKAMDKVINDLKVKLNTNYGLTPSVDMENWSVLPPKQGGREIQLDAQGNPIG